MGSVRESRSIPMGGGVTSALFLLPRPAGREPPRSWAGGHAVPGRERWTRPGAEVGSGRGAASSRPWTAAPHAIGVGRNRAGVAVDQLRQGANGGVCRVPGATRGRRGALARGRSADGATGRPPQPQARGWGGCDQQQEGQCRKRKPPVFVLPKTGGVVGQLFAISPLLRKVLELLRKSRLLRK